MLERVTKLTFLHNDDGTIHNYSDQAQDLLRDSFILGAVDQTDDCLYIGYSKPINAVYVEIKVEDAYDAVLTLEYYNGSTWASAAGFIDETKGFIRSGFCQWNRNQETESLTEVNGTSQYWYRIKTDTTFNSDVELYGISLLFSDDQTLLEEFPLVTHDSFYPNQSDKRHTAIHIAVRNEIVQKFRNKDYYISNSLGNRELNHWDLLEIDEVRQGAKYLALGKIFFNASDSADDNYAAKSAMYEKLGQEALQLVRLSVDSEDTGKKNPSSYAQLKTTRLIR